MTPNSPPPFEHAQHERTLVLRYVEDDSELTREERLLASALLRTCAWCAALGPEVALIADANRQLIVPPAGRDFRITPAQARGRRGFNVAATGARIRAALRTELVRPLAGAAVAVGLVIAVVGAVPYLANAAPTPTPGIEAVTGPANATSASAAAPEYAVPTPESNAAGSQLGESPVPFPQADASTAGDIGDTSAETQPVDPSTLRSGNASMPSPSEAPQVANITAPAPSAAPGDNSGQSSGAVETQPKSADSAGQEPLPPLLIFGVLLAIVGLLVLGLTVLARRMEPAS